MLAAIADGAARKTQAQYLQRLLREGAAVFHVHAEGLVFPRRETAPQADFQASLRDHIQHRYPLREMHGVMIRRGNHTQT